MEVCLHKAGVRRSEGALQKGATVMPSSGSKCLFDSAGDRTSATGSNGGLHGCIWVSDDQVGAVWVMGACVSTVFTCYLCSLDVVHGGRYCFIHKYQHPPVNHHHQPTHPGRVKKLPKEAEKSFGRLFPRTLGLYTRYIILVGQEI